MSKRITFTTITPLPASTSRQTAISHLHDHLTLLDLNPLVQSAHHLLSPPPHAAPSEFRCTWYSLTDRRVPGLPAPASYTAAFENLPDGVRTHAYAPMGRDVRETWTIGGTLPGEVPAPGVVEPGLDVPSEGLYLRQDVEARCNVLVAGFVRRTLRKTHAALVEFIEAGAEAETEASSPPSPTDAFRSFANDETFLGPQRQPAGTGSNFFLAGNHTTDPPASTRSAPSPPPFLRAPGAAPTTSPPPPPTFLQPGSAPTSRSPSPPTRSPPPPPAFLRAPEAERLPESPRRMYRPSAPTPSRVPNPYPPPLSIPKRHSTGLSFPSPSQYSPSTPAWARDSLPRRPHSAAPSRTTSVVSRYPHAAEQDYSDIAATNPFDSDDESDATADTCFSDAAGGVLTESPVTFIVASSAGAPAELPGDVPQVDLRFEVDESGLGLGIGVPGELMEETYEVLEGKLPVLEDKRASARPLKMRGAWAGRRASNCISGVV